MCRQAVPDLAANQASEIQEERRDRLDQPILVLCDKSRCMHASKQASNYWITERTHLSWQPTRHLRVRKRAGMYLTSPYSLRRPMLAISTSTPAMQSAGVAAVRDKAAEINSCKTVGWTHHVNQPQP